MIKNYFIIAWRSLWRNKLYSFINISGLAIGITCCVLIYLYVQKELSYDKFNTKADDIYRLTLRVHEEKKDFDLAATAPIMGPMIKENFPEIKNSVRLSLPFDRCLTYKGKKIFDNKIVTSDSTFFDVFTFPLLQGDAKTALNEPYKIVITESMAKKLFGNEPALGKTMQYGNYRKDETQKNITVSGIIKDVPENSHLAFDALLSRSTIHDLYKKDSLYLPEKENNWHWAYHYTYFVVKENTDIKSLEAKISAFTEKQFPERRSTDGYWYSGKLQPLKDIHLHSDMDREVSPNSDIKYIYIFSGTALLILLIACFNFINLSTARSLNRSKEIGLRKVIGAARYQLVQQLLGESLFFTLIAAAFSVFLVLLILPFFNSFTESDFKVDHKLIALYSIIIFIVGLFSGLYPAFLISSFKPITALKGHLRHSWQDIILRKGLVIFQFSIAIVLIIGTQVIVKQLNFVQNKKMGMQKEQMIQLNFLSGNKSKQETFLKEISADPNIVSASLNNFSFKSLTAVAVAALDKETPRYTAENTVIIDENFISTFQLSLVSGRNVKNSIADEDGSFLINETAARSFGWKSAKEAIGKQIEWAGIKEGQVIGVVKDFNYTSLHDPVKPLIMHIFANVLWNHNITIRINAQNTNAAITAIENKWKQMFIDVPFEYSFMQDDFNGMYKSEQKLASMLGAFTTLAIIVSCLGLFGLVAFTIKQRVREIGIRKVLGSSVTNIVQLLSKDFIKLVMVAIIIAIPVAWVVMNKWLQGFAYKITISWWIFLLAGFLAIAIAVVTISFQAIKAAIANPIKSLRSE